MDSPGRCPRPTAPSLTGHGPAGRRGSRRAGHRLLSWRFAIGFGVWRWCSSRWPWCAAPAPAPGWPWGAPRARVSPSRSPPGSTRRPGTCRTGTRRACSSCRSGICSSRDVDRRVLDDGDHRGRRGRDDPGTARARACRARSPGSTPHPGSTSTTALPGGLPPARLARHARGLARRGQRRARHGRDGPRRARAADDPGHAGPQRTRQP